MEKQRGLFEEGGQGSEEVFRRLPEEVRVVVRSLLAELVIQRLKTRRKETRNER